MSTPADVAASLKVLSLSVPVLAEDGSNWPHWKSTVQVAIKSKAAGLMEYLEGSEPKPDAMFWDSKDKDWKWKDTAKTTAPTEAEIKAFKVLKNKWDHEDSVVLIVLISTLNPQMQLQARKFEKSCDVWDMLIKKYGTKTSLSHQHYLTQLYALRCEEGGDVRAHIEDMLRIREALANLDYKVDE